jgi:hypothetical protein
MANVYLARLNPSDYEMVRGNLNNDLPVTHEEWLRFQAKGEIDFARQGIPLAISQLILTNSPGIAAITGGTAAITVSWISS